MNTVSFCISTSPLGSITKIVFILNGKKLGETFFTTINEAIEKILKLNGTFRHLGEGEMLGTLQTNSPFSLFDVI